MVDLKDDVALSAVESSLHNEVKALLKGMTSQRSSQKGLLRWNLEKRVETDPSCSVALVTVLLRKLEKKLNRSHEVQSHMHVIPILHTLYYVVIQSEPMIPASLYERVYECLLKLLILPLPYSVVALHTLKSIKMEMTTPGSLYLRRVMAEQNLNNKHFMLQEKVFVLADPAVFSARLEATVRAHLEVCSLFRDTIAMEKDIVAHVLQAGLGTECQSSRLATALDALGDQMVEQYYEKVVLAVEHGIRDGIYGCVAYINRLQQIQRDILTAAKEEITKKDCGSLCSIAMSFPEIRFLLWKDEEDLWNLLADFTLRSSSISSGDEDDMDKRHSVWSEDSGIERDLKMSDYDDTEQPSVRNPASAFMRRNVFKNSKTERLSLMMENIEVFPGSSSFPQEVRRCHTARVVVMGDDRVLGRLSRAYHSIRERESNHLMLTKKLNLQLYYIPVTGVEPSPTSPHIPCQGGARLSRAFILGGVDPWYNSNINSLITTISKLPGKLSDHSQPSEKNLFLLDTLCYYLRCGTQPVNLPLYSVKMTRSSCGETSVVEEMFVSHLEANIPEFRHLNERFTKEHFEHQRKATVEVLGAVITVSYTKTSLSKREVVTGEAPMTFGLVITSVLGAATTGEDYLAVRFDSVNPRNNTKIQSQNISIKTMEHRTLSVCLDKDPRRTYADIRRIEISPCLDPGFRICSRFSVSKEQEVQLSKYLNKVLSLPINTFTGVAH